VLGPRVDTPDIIEGSNRFTTGTQADPLMFSLLGLSIENLLHGRTISILPELFVTYVSLVNLRESLLKLLVVAGLLAELRAMYARGTTRTIQGVHPDVITPADTHL
jgi:hypothetical protein